MARVNRRFYFSRRITSPWPTSWSLRSEEHTSELQSRLHLVCRLLLEKKNNSNNSLQVALATPPPAQVGAFLAVAMPGDQRLLTSFSSSTPTVNPTVPTF